MTEKITPQMSHTVAKTMAAIFTVMPTLVLFAAKGIVPALILLTSIAAFDLWQRRPPLPQIERRWMVPALFLAWAALSTSWAADHISSLKSLAGISGIFAGTIILALSIASAGRSAARQINTGLMIGFAVMCAVYLFEYATDGLLLQIGRDILAQGQSTLKDYRILYNSGLIILTAIAVPLVLLTWARQRVLGIGMAIGIIAAATLADAAVIIVALGVGFLAFAAARLLPRAFPVAVLLVLAAVGLSLPFNTDRLPDPRIEVPTGEGLWPPVASRMLIWRAAAENIEKSPIIGLGLNASKNLYPRATRKMVKVYYDHGPLEIFVEPIPLHPHNVMLQIWLELGGVGALLFIVLIAQGFYAIANSDLTKNARAAIMASATTLLFVANISFGIWQKWWLTAIILTFILAYNFCRTLTEKTENADIGMAALHDQAERQGR